MTGIDIALCGLYLVVTLVIGGLVGRRQRSTEDYFLAGRGMRWWPVAISLFASLFSAISYIAMPAEAYNFGCTMLVCGLVSVLALPVMLFVFLRFFHAMRLFTINEYLERRFSVRIRLINSLFFICVRLTYLGVVLYATAMLLDRALGWPAWLSVIVVGLFCTLYTSMGGMEAVVWTDVMQFFVLLGGVLLIIGAVAWDMPGGVAGIWQFASEQGHGFELGASSGFWDFDQRGRINIWPLLLGLPGAFIGPATDQINLQRCMSCAKFSDVTRAVMANTILNVPICFIFYFAGLAVFAFFKSLHPELDSGLNGDLAFCQFITTHLPMGLRGVLAAGVLAAVMSTVDSVENSLSAVFVKDIYGRVLRPGREEAHYLKVAKATTAVIGLSTCLFGLLVLLIFKGRDIPLLEISNVCLGVLGSFSMGIFVLGLLSVRVTPKAMLIGIVGAIPFAVYFTVFRYLLPPVSERIGFMYLGLWISLPELIIAYLASFLCHDNPPDHYRYVIWSRWFKKRDTPHA